jgi:cholesterol transport system auxiliary component
MSMRRVFGRAAPLVAALLALAACGGSLFKSNVPAPTVYMLDAGGAAPKAAAAGAPQVAADLTVLMPLVRAGLNTERIAALYPDRRLDYYEAARWSAPLDAVVEDLALQSLRAHANFRSVGSDSSAFNGEYWLQIEVADFQAEYGQGAAAPTIHVRLLASVGKAADLRVIRRFVADRMEPAAENRLSSIVAAYNRAADAALVELVSDTVLTISASPR